MRYFVIAPDGSKYGPADIATLRAWVTEGRISPDTILEEEQSRQRVAARLVAGLFATEGPYHVPPGQPFARPPEYSRRKGDGSADVVMSYICSAMSIICCGLFIIGAFVYANRAIARGNKGGKAAFIVAIFFLILWIVTTIIEIKFFNQLKEMIMPRLGIE